jgi:NAD-dependent deacetylase
VAKARPNPGHEALARWEAKVPEFTLITQNVDGLHARAGSRNILELHGNIWRTRCTSCHSAEERHEVPLREIPPTCGACGELLRPDVVWFGESLDPQVLGAAIEASRTCEVFVVAGTSGVVQPAASLAALAVDAGATVVEVNPDPTPLTAIVHHRLGGPGGEVLPELVPY